MLKVEIIFQDDADDDDSAFPSNKRARTQTQARTQARTQRPAPAVSAVYLAAADAKDVQVESKDLSGKVIVVEPRWYFWCNSTLCCFLRARENMFKSSLNPFVDSRQISLSVLWCCKYWPDKSSPFGRLWAIRYNLGYLSTDDRLKGNDTTFWF